MRTSTHRPPRLRPLLAWVALGTWAALVPHAAVAQVPGELHGRVTSTVTAAPIPDAIVETLGGQASSRSDADGVFVLRGLEPRSYTVRVRALGYIKRDLTVAIENGRSTAADVSLAPAPHRLSGVTVKAARDTQATSAIVYDRDAIESSGRRDVGELLRTTPGVVITQAGGPGSETTVSIRGSSANEVLVLVDGVPVNSAITGEADLSRIPLESVERITVRAGSQSAR